MSGIPADAARYRSARDGRTPPEFRQMLSDWIADDVAAGRTPPKGLIWMYVAARRLERLAFLLHRARGAEWATERGVEPGAHVILSCATQGTVEGMVQSVDGWWAILDTKPAPGYLLIGADVEVVLSGCLSGCVLGDGHDEPCLTDADIAEERLKSRDYDAWAAL